MYAPCYTLLGERADNKNMYSWIDIKKKFKYFINLPGHTYCTKIYTMLFCKRLIFYIEPKLKFNWPPIST